MVHTQFTNGSHSSHEVHKWFTRSSQMVHTQFTMVHTLFTNGSHNSHAVHTKFTQFTYSASILMKQLANIVFPIANN